MIRSAFRSLSSAEAMAGHYANEARLGLAEIDNVARAVIICKCDRDYRSMKLGATR